MLDNLRFKGARSAARIDNAVGDRIRKRRMLLGYTQEQLADTLEISYQQIQKYETGANRVSAGRLFQIAQRLEAPISYFFEGLGLEFDAEVGGLSGGLGSNRTVIEVVRNLNQIGDPSVRSAVASLVKALAASGAGDEVGVESGDKNDLADLMADHADQGNGHSAGHSGRHGRNGGDHSAED